MCLIAYQPAESKRFAKSVFKNGWSDNPDGAGYMFSHAGILIIRKPFYKLKELWKAYKADHENYGQASAFVVHFRYATHGSDDAVNIHPHPLADGKVGMVHNGILPFEPPHKSGISDTVFFCRTVLGNRQPSFLMGNHCRSWLGEMIGRHNKLVFMDGKGRVSIVNPDSGMWDMGNWYSNRSYLPSLPTAETLSEWWDRMTTDAEEAADELAWAEACYAAEREED